MQDEQELKQEEAPSNGSVSAGPEVVPISKSPRRPIRHFTKHPSHPERRFGSIKELKCFDEVKRRLIDGEQTKDIARFIQEDCGEYLGVERTTVDQALGLFRKTFTPTELLAARTPKVVIDARKRFGDGSIELERLDELYEYQKLRLERLKKLEAKKILDFLEAEKGEKKPSWFSLTNNRLGFEVMNLKEIIKTMHEIKMDLGLHGGRNLGTLTVAPQVTEDIRRSYGEGAARAFQNPESRGKIMSIIKTVKMLAEKTETGTSGNGSKSA